MMSTAHTFGIELEIALTWRIPRDTPVLSTNNKDPMDVIHDAVVRRLISCGVEAQRSKGAEGYDNWRVHYDFSIHLDKWQLICDLWGATSVFEPDQVSGECQDEDGNRYAVANIELISPIYKLDDNWTQDLVEVVEAVTTGEYRSLTDHSCGFHVHVGIGVGNVLPFDLMKRMAVVTTLLEQEMDMMHPIYRRTNNLYCESSRTSPSLRRLSRAEVFESIRAAPTADEFTDLLQRNELGIMKCFKVNYLGLLGTIEFRQHRGTLEVEEIEKWVRFVVGMTANVANASWKELERILLSGEWRSLCRTLLGVGKIERYSKQDKDMLFPLFG
jgi:hypothetical protein